MYVKNTIAKRRASGWADRRRYFRHLISKARLALKNEEIRKTALVIEKD